MEVRAIFGPPGTGKTSTMVEFVEQEVAADNRPVFLSYTRAAAAEATSRVNGEQVQTSTIHSLAYRALGVQQAAVVDGTKLKDFSEATGYPFKDPRSDDPQPEEGDDYLSVLSFARNRLMEIGDAWDHFGRPGTRDRFDVFVHSYMAWKAAHGYLDFDDMLERYAHSERIRPRHRIIFLDEAQDCTPLQWLVFQKACAEAKRVYIAGDDDQAIYEWNGADPHGMAHAVKVTNGKMRVLAKSHRLPEAVHTVALHVATNIKRRVDKQFTHNGNLGDIAYYGDADIVLAGLQKIAPDGALFLARDRFKLEEARRSLNAELIPYEVLGGMSPWTSKIAQEIRAGKMKNTSPDIPVVWREFYRHADLSLPIKYKLSTIHQAKGREHDTVIVNLELPPRVLAGLDLDPDAEARVLYVAVSRARQKLILCGQHPQL